MKAIALVAVLSLAALTLAPAEAVARAGSGGSRGSRSFSSPARPSSPTSSPTPTSPSRATNPSSPAPFAQRGFFGGGLLGGLAGFALGGLLGSMLFGHGFGGGFGLLDLLLIGGGLFLLFRMMSRRPQPEPAYAPAGGDGRGGYTVEMPAGPATDLERGLGQIRQMDPAFDPDALLDGARTTFAAVQAAVTGRDMAPVASRLTSRMYTELTAQCDRLRNARQTNHIEGIDIRRAEITEAWQEGGQDYVTVYLEGALVDYTLDDASNALVDGRRTAQDFEEFWTFTRPVGPHPWKLSAIQTG